MVYGFLNFFCVSEGGPPESRAWKGSETMAEVPERRARKG
jgi:hypothetical protein